MSTPKAGTAPLDCRPLGATRAGSFTPTGPCEYIMVSSDGYYSTWKSDCGQTDCFETGEDMGLPVPPSYNFCPHCGRKLIARPWFKKK